MSLNFNVRRADSKDIPSLVGLLGVLFSIETDFTVDESKQRRGIEMMLDDTFNRCIMIAEIDLKVVGMCTAQILVSTAEGGPVAVIEDVVVDKDNRRKGIGRELLLAIENWAIERGTTRLQLLADQNNTLALEFYKSMNWNLTHLVCLHKK